MNLFNGAKHDLCNCIVMRMQSVQVTFAEFIRDVFSEFFRITFFPKYFASCGRVYPSYIFQSITE